MKLTKIITTAGLALSCSLFFGLSANAAGDTMETATELSIGGNAQKDSMTEADNIRWYKCTIPNDIGNQWVLFSCTNNMNQAIDISVNEADGTPLDYATLDTKDSWTLTCNVPNSGTNESYSVVEPGNTYYIKAEGSIIDKVSGKYSVQIKTVSDDNWGTMEQAPEISVGKKGTGTLERFGDVDHYKFTIPEIPEDSEKEYTYTLFFAGSNTCMATLVDPDDIEKDSISGYGEKFSESKEITFSAGEGGTYYLKVSDSDSDAGKTAYSFNLSKGSSSALLNAPSPSKDNDTNSNTDSDAADNTSAKKTIKMLAVTAKKNTKKIAIASLKGAKFVVTAQRKIIKNGKKVVKKLTKTSTNGKLNLTLSKKLKKGDRIKVTVSKTGWKTKSVTVKIK